MSQPWGPPHPTGVDRNACGQIQSGTDPTVLEFQNPSLEIGLAGIALSPKQRPFKRKRRLDGGPELSSRNAQDKRRNDRVDDCAYQKTEVDERLVFAYPVHDALYPVHDDASSNLHRIVQHNLLYVRLTTEAPSGSRTVCTSSRVPSIPDQQTLQSDRLGFRAQPAQSRESRPDHRPDHVPAVRRSQPGSRGIRRVRGDRQQQTARATDAILVLSSDATGRPSTGRASPGTLKYPPARPPRANSSTSLPWRRRRLWAGRDRSAYSKPACRLRP